VLTGEYFGFGVLAFFVSAFAVETTRETSFVGFAVATTGETSFAGDASFATDFAGDASIATGETSFAGDASFATGECRCISTFTVRAITGGGW
jgi:hypothetical protein